MQTTDALGGRYLPNIIFKRGDQSYMMRSEKRPGYGNHGSGSGGGKKPRGKRVLAALYTPLTMLLLLLLYPIGLVLLWRRRIRWTGMFKLGVSLLTAVVFFSLSALLLTQEFDDPRLTDAQQKTIRVLGVFRDVAEEAYGGTRAFVLGMSDSAQKNIGAFSENAGIIAAIMGDKAIEGIRQAADAADALRSGPSAPSPAPSPAALVSASPTPVGTAPVRTDAQVPGAQGTPRDTPTPSAATAPAATDQKKTEVGISTPDASAAPRLTPTPGSTPTPAIRPTPTNTPRPTPTAQGQGQAHIAATAAPMGRIARAMRAQETPDASPEAPSPSAQETTSVGSAPTREATQPPTPTLTPSPILTPTPTPALTPTPTPLPTATPSFEPIVDATPEQGVGTVFVPVPRIHLGTTAAPDALPTLTPAPAPTLKPIGEMLVWHTTNGRWYHRASVCGSMSNAREYTLTSSVASGLTACPYCHPLGEGVDESILGLAEAVWLDGAGRWHLTDACEALPPQWEIASLGEAVAAGAAACPDCGAPAYLAARAAPGAETADESLLIYLGDEDPHYHLDGQCANGLGALRPGRLSEAIEDQREPCPLCQPPRFV